MAAKPKRIVNHVALVVDASGSMQGKETLVVQEVKRLIQQFQDKKDQETRVSLYTFNYDTKILFGDIRADMCEKDFLYYPNGGTALTDAILTATKDLLARKPKRGTNTAYLVMVITDGEENSSHAVPVDVKWYAQRDNVTITLLGPPTIRSYARQAGISEGNVLVWDGTTDTDFRRATTHTNSSIHAYTVSRASGQSKVQDFYSIDLSKVTAGNLQQLVDMKSEFRRYVVPGETTIAAFVEAKTRRPYLKGSSFYQLTKPELIQHHKELLVEDRDTDKIYGGEEARKVLGIPKYTNAKVAPKNLSHYTVFVQSTSANRKLVRGTNVLVRR